MLVCTGDKIELGYQGNILRARRYFPSFLSKDKVRHDSNPQATGRQSICSKKVSMPPLGQLRPQA